MGIPTQRGRGGGLLVNPKSGATRTKLYGPDTTINHAKHHPENEFHIWHCDMKDDSGCSHTVPFLTRPAAHDDSRPASLRDMTARRVWHSRKRGSVAR